MRKRLPKGERSKYCSKCNGLIEENRHGKYRYCKSCHNEHMKCIRPKHKDLTNEARIKVNSRAYANVYLNRGAIKKQPCMICGNEKSQMHHDDYTKPLEIKWLCREHHLELHKKIEDGL